MRPVGHLSVAPGWRCVLVVASLILVIGELVAEEKSLAPLPARAAAVDDLATRLADAPDDTTRDAALAASVPAPDLDKVYLALQMIEYRIVLQGDLTRAEALVGYMEKLARRGTNPRAILAVQISRADIHSQLGESAEALALLNPLIAGMANSGDFQLLTSANIHAGICYHHEADYARALSRFRQALVLSEANGYRDGAIPALNSIGEVFRGQGQPGRALEYYQRAREWLGDDTAWNNTFLFNNIAMSYLALGDRAKAVEFLRRAEEIAIKTGQKPRAATALAVLGDISRLEGRLDEARADLERSLALARETRDSEAEGRAELGLAECARAGGDHPAALGLADAAAASYRRANRPDGLSAALTAAGLEHQASAAPAQARQAFEEAIEITEAVRGQLAGGDLDAQQYFKSKVSPYQGLVALLAEQPGGAADALRVAERAKARTLLDIVRRSEPDAVAHLTPAERGREAELNRRLAASNHRFAKERANSGPSGSPVLAASPVPVGAAAGPSGSESEIELAQACQDWDRFQADLLAAHPELARQRPAVALLSNDDLARWTDGGKTAVLEFVVTDEKTYLLTVGGAKRGVEAFALPVGRAALTRRVEAFRTELAQRGLTWQESSRALYADLLKPAEAVWQSAHRLVIVPDGPLWNLPFQALETSAGHCLVEDHALSDAPSLTFLTSSRRDPEVRGGLQVLAMGNPSLGNAAATVSDNGFASLPETEKEIAAVQELYPAADCHVYLGARAQEDVFKRVAPNCDILHLATHGVLNESNPLFSYLLLAQTDLAPGEDGLLEARELMSMHLRARLAILSACETGRGQITGGEGMIGLGWALFVAGCPASVLSQWKVDSAATAELMTELHRQLRSGADPDEALRRASLEVSNRPGFRHPFYWAPFVLVGAGGPLVEGR